MDPSCLRPCTVPGVSDRDALVAVPSSPGAKKGLTSFCGDSWASRTSWREAGHLVTMLRYVVGQEQKHQAPGELCSMEWTPMSRPR